eukprot:351389-Chlamydomonas_euryale.AAC.4
MQRACSVYGACMQVQAGCAGRACSVHAGSMGHACSVHAQCMGHACSVHAVCMGHACSVHAVCMGRARSVHAVCMRVYGARMHCARVGYARRMQATYSRLCKTLAGGQLERYLRQLSMQLPLWCVRL